MSQQQRRTEQRSIDQHRAARNPAMQKKIAQMALPLSSLVRVTTGDVHPIFPSTLLNFWLLTSEQCDELAHFYHQRTPGPLTFHYPCPVPWDTNSNLEEKRRRIGRFIGLRGCESPVKSEEDILEQMMEARQKESEEELFKSKTRWY